MRSLAFLVAVSFLFALGGCATLESGGDGSDRHRLTAEEIQEADASNLFELVERERPRWLQVRGARSATDPGSTRVLVYEGNTRLGGVEVLESFIPAEVEWLEYVDGTTAAASLPGLADQHVAGVIKLHR